MLLAAKPNWKTFSYDTITKMAAGDVNVTADLERRGLSHAARQCRRSSIAYPKEGIEAGWTTSSC